LLAVGANSGDDRRLATPTDSRPPQGGCPFSGLFVGGWTSRPHGNFASQPGETELTPH
jgi:hypothetical protein